MLEVRTQLQGSRNTPVVRVQAPSRFDPAAVADLAAHLRRLGENCPLVVDVSDVTLTNPDFVQALLGPLRDDTGEGAAIRVVATRLTARRLLRRWLSELPLFASVEEALLGLEAPARPSLGPGSGGARAR